MGGRGTSLPFQYCLFCPHTLAKCIIVSENRRILKYKDCTLNLNFIKNCGNLYILDSAVFAL